HRQGDLSRATHFREPHLLRVPSPDAALRVSALGRNGDRAGRPDPCLGKAEPAAKLSDATRGRAAGVSSDDAAAVVASRMGTRMFMSATLRTLAVHIRAFRKDQRGATAIEYALVASGVAAAIAATVFNFGSELKTTFYDKIAALL